MPCWDDGVIGARNADVFSFVNGPISLFDPGTEVFLFQNEFLPQLFFQVNGLYMKLGHELL